MSPAPPSSASDRAKELLRATRGQPLGRSARATRACQLASALLSLSREHTAQCDRRRARMLARMMEDERGQQLTTALTDRLYRSRNEARTLDEVAALLRTYGTPRFMRAHERLGLLGVQGLGPLDPPLLTTLMARGLASGVRREARDVLLDAGEEALAAHLATRHREHAYVNVNQLGEALLGEREAEARVAKYVALAARDGIDALSVKVSSVASQLAPLAFDAQLHVVSERLSRIYRASLRAESALPLPRARDQHTSQPLVMLDMEAYGHIELTLAALFQALSTPALDRVRAGVVLQAYLPDAHALLERVQRYAAARVARGGVPLRLRIVKGANLAHERVESAKAGASLPIYASKREVDASFKRLLEHALTRNSTRSLHVGVASHNLFDLSYALLLRAEGELEPQVELELLEGMADPVRRALASLDVGLLLYAPICHDDELNSGIAYLVRRLDENTAPENYLRNSFDMTPASASFAQEEARFLAAVTSIDELASEPRRARDAGFDRRRASPRTQRRDFEGEADTDFTRQTNRHWVADALAHAAAEPQRLVRSQIAGSWLALGELVDGVDPSRPGQTPYRVRLADTVAVERALACAAADPARFAERTLEERSHLLMRCAAGLREARASLIATMVLDAGKRVAEADVEISEAVDFAEYYRTSFAELLREQPLSASPRGTVLVTPPWNFPLAIPAGGIFAALMAGNRVLFKPALETALTAQLLSEVLWAAGVPREALQLLVCNDEVASALVRDARVSTVILTGATATARLFQALRPGLRLLAETGGKNAFVVSAMSDRELAIRDVVASAFGHAGQKCSAASLLICEAEAYDDPAFLETLRDAVESLKVGSSWAPDTFVTPLIHPPEAELARALSTLSPGESWLVEPRVDPSNPRLISPGVKLGVVEGSFTHTTELFGPLLGVMRADSIEHAVALANATGYGLTAGLSSLDEREQQYFCEQMRAGNLYINRTITGAIVQRQPFGGIGKSGFGPGAKAGGPNYVAQLCHLRVRRERTRELGTLPDFLEARVLLLSAGLPLDDARELRARAHDFARVDAAHFAREHDPAAVVGQHNIFRYRPCHELLLRIERDATALEIASSCLAADVVGAQLQISLAPTVGPAWDASRLGHPLTVESLAQLLQRAPRRTRLRLLGTREALHDQLNTKTGMHIADEPVLALGRVELLHYLTEQSISNEYHRYGHVPQPAK